MNKETDGLFILQVDMKQGIRVISEKFKNNPETAKRFIDSYMNYDGMYIKYARNYRFTSEMNKAKVFYSLKTTKSNNPDGVCKIIPINFSTS